MKEQTPQELDRLHALLADRATLGLNPDEEAELDALLARAGSNAAEQQDELVAGLILAADNPDEAGMPSDLRARLATRGVLLTGAAGAPAHGSSPAGRRGPWLALAAVIAIAGVTISLLTVSLRERTSSLEEAKTVLVEMRERVESNEQLLAQARTRAETLSGEIADAARRETELAERLAEATAGLADVSSELDRARLEIAKYEQPDDPAELQADRRLLLSMEDTVVVPWRPFDLPDAPAEQGNVQGDVVWNDDLQTGFLRFIGLKVNDPESEQYQVWVIDERGMEQKVSGGVFNASAEGEVIVPIEPGIDVGRVALFAITIEDPGGTWVPDLSRRVVVGTRDGG
ncbi:MAG: anti-sigma factor [Phycisphaerales bacterium]